MILFKNYKIKDSRFNTDVEIRIEYQIYGRELFINTQAYCLDFYGYDSILNENINDINNIEEEVMNTVLSLGMVELAMKDLIREIEFTRKKIKENYNG